MTQTELAARMGVSCVQITKLLSGRENVGLQTIAKVEKALGRSLVTFHDSAETSGATTVRFTFNQVISLPVYCALAENFAVGLQSPNTFFRLSTDKILV